MRMDDFALFVVFDDSCAVLHGLDNLLRKITGPLSQVQVRELAAHFACCNMHLENRPLFRTRVERGEPPRVSIEGFHDPSPQFAKRDNKIFGGFMEWVLGEFLPHIQVSGRSPEELPPLLRSGALSFMFNDNGDFIAA
jgi:hypothetical protein